MDEFVPHFVRAIKQSYAAAAAEWRAHQDQRRLRVARNILVKEYLSRHREVLIHLGCGDNILPDWLNSDIKPSLPTVAYIDATEPLPFPHQCASAVFCEHMIEHITLRQGRRAMQEFFRILKPGGYARIATPDLFALRRLLADSLSNEAIEYLEWATPFNRVPAGFHAAGVVFNRLMNGHGHKFVYDKQTIAAALNEVGFVSINFLRPGISEQPCLRNIEQHARKIGATANAFETMVVEAQRPLS